MIKKIKNDLKKRLPHNRYNHTIRVCEIAIELAKLYDENIEDATIAALLHDYSKYLDKKQYMEIIKKNNLEIDSVIEEELGLAHGLISEYFAKEKYKIKNENILNAIRYHTFGRSKMSKLEKIIYLADYIELGRSFEGIEEIRKATFEDLDKGMILALESSIKYVNRKGKLLHPLTVEAKNYLLNKE